MQAPPAPPAGWNVIFRQTALFVQATATWAEFKPTDATAPNFSALSSLETYRANDGKFVLKIQWPEREGQNFNVWKQGSNPVTSEVGGVNGYQGIEIAFTDQSWGGLERQPGGAALLDGSVDHGNWFYAVGAGSEWSGGFPGASSPENVVELHAFQGEDYVGWAPPPPAGFEWRPIFRQTAPFVQSTAEWVSYNPTDTDAPNFSALNTMEQCRADGKLQFKLQWPEKAGDNYQEWTQTSNPMLSHPVEGYINVNSPYTQNSWGGLEQQPGGPSLMDGTVNHGNWFYAVGAASTWGGGFPGAFEAESVVELWLLCPPGGAPPPPPDGWALMMRQTAGFYQTVDEWETSFGSDTDDNYSALDTMENWRGADNGKFHLKLVYPDEPLANDGVNFNEWQQTTNFVTNTANGVDGYQAIEIGYTLLANVDAADNNDGNFYGLEHNTDGIASGDGSVDHGYWFYAIGSTGEWSGGVPGGTWTPATKVELWVNWPVVVIPDPPPPPQAPPAGWKVLLRQTTGNYICPWRTG